MRQIKTQLLVSALLLMNMAVVAQQSSKSAFQQITGRALNSYSTSFNGPASFGLSLTPNTKQTARLHAVNEYAQVGLNASREKVSFNQFKRADELPKSSLGVTFTPYYSLSRNPFDRNDTWRGIGGKLSVDYEFFLTNKLSVLTGFSYGRKWFKPFESTNDLYQSHEFGGYVLGRYRFTNTERRMVWFVEGGIGYANEDFKGIEARIIGDDDRSYLNYQIGLGTEYKLSDKVTLTGVIGHRWSHDKEIRRLNVKLGGRIRL